MKNILIIKLFIFFVFFLNLSYSQDPKPPSSVPLPAGATEWKLIFNDEFDGNTYDTSKWNPYADWGGVGSFNNGRENYYPSQIRLSKGICNLIAEPNPSATTFTNSYKSGELISARANTNSQTPYKFTFLYGYIEARIKIVDVSGFFGAFWMLPAKKNYVYEWEIDILEVLGHDHRTMFQTYHYCPGLPLDQSRNTSWTPNKGTGNNGNAPVIDYSTDYHTFGVDWQKDHLTFYIDGIASGTFPNPGTNNSNIPNTPGYILIQHMVENNWIRSTGHLLPDSTKSVDTFHIDYVRVWQGINTNTTKLIENKQRESEMARIKINQNGTIELIILDKKISKCDADLEILNLSGSSLFKNKISDAKKIKLKKGIYFYKIYFKEFQHQSKGRIFYLK